MHSQELENEKIRRKKLFTQLDSLFKPKKETIQRCFEKCVFSFQSNDMEIEEEIKHNFL